MKIVETGIRERLGENNVRSSSCDDEDALPEHVVINSYVGNASIAQHHDGDAVFDAVYNQAVIFSLNIQRDGVLFFKLQGNKQGHTPSRPSTFPDEDTWPKTLRTWWSSFTIHF
jgi:alkylated DNA repair dioxygenase AlkB